MKGLVVQGRRHSEFNSQMGSRCKGFGGGARLTVRRVPAGFWNLFKETTRDAFCLATNVQAVLSHSRVKAPSMFVTLRAEVLKQLDGAILFFNDANGGGGGGQDIQVADFACTLANAPEIAEQVALATSGIRRQSAEGGFEAADVGTQSVNLLKSGALGRFLHDRAELAHCFADPIGFQGHCDASPKK